MLGQRIGWIISKTTVVIVNTGLKEQQCVMFRLSPQEFHMLSDDHLNELKKELIKLVSEAQPNINYNLSALNECIEAEVAEHPQVAQVNNR